MRRKQQMQSTNVHKNLSSTMKSSNGGPSMGSQETSASLSEAESPSQSTPSHQCERSTCKILWQHPRPTTKPKTNSTQTPPTCREGSRQDLRFGFRPDKIWARTWQSMWSTTTQSLRHTTKLERA